jgi:hypothetical protein
VKKMDYQPTPNEVERIKNAAQQQNKNDLKASGSVLKTMANTLPQNKHKTQKDQPNIME